MFREKRFRIRKIEEIFKDIDEARSTFSSYPVYISH